MCRWRRPPKPSSGWPPRPGPRPRKLKTADFRILTRSLTPASPPGTLAEVVAIALELRSRVELPARVRYRLVGVGLANFRAHDELPPQASLFNDGP